MFGGVTGGTRSALVLHRGASKRILRGHSSRLVATCAAGMGEPVQKLHLIRHGQVRLP